MVRMLQLENPHYNVIGLVRFLARPNLPIQTNSPLYCAASTFLGS